MALTIDKIEYSSLGNRRVVTAKLSLDGAYPDGGYSMTPGNFRFREFMFCLFETKGGYLFEYDYDNEKLKAMYPRGAVDDTFLAELDEGEVAVTSTGPNGMIISTSGEPGMTGGAGSEVLDNVDLHLIKDIRFFGVGY